MTALPGARLFWTPQLIGTRSRLRPALADLERLLNSWLQFDITENFWLDLDALSPLEEQAGLENYIY